MKMEIGNRKSKIGMLIGILLLAFQASGLGQNVRVINGPKEPVPVYVAQPPAGTVPTPTPPATAAKQDTQIANQTNGTQKTQVTLITGAASIATGQVTTSTAASTFVAARATRRSVLLKNLDATITVYYGPATVTTANGMELKPGESRETNTVALIQVIAASGTPKVAYEETYD